MCIIIQKPKGKVVPHVHLHACVRNNPHGWGLMAADGEGKHISLKDHKAPSSTQLARLINEELSDHEVMLHLRYNTKGTTSLRNAHPFPVLWEKTDGVELRMFHNGTIYDYGPKHNTPEADKWESDTRKFVRTFVRPLFTRLNYTSASDILEDDFVRKILQSEVGEHSKNVLAFMDGKGKSYYINKGANGGVEWDGVYYSNTYSLDPEHREPAPQTRLHPNTPVKTTETPKVEFNQWDVCDYDGMDEMADWIKHTKDMNKVQMLREMKKLADLAKYWYQSYWEDGDWTENFPADSSKKVS